MIDTIEKIIVESSVENFLCYKTIVISKITSKVKSLIEQSQCPRCLNRTFRIVLFNWKNNEISNLRICYKCFHVFTLTAKYNPIDFNSHFQEDKERRRKMKHSKLGDHLNN